MPNRLAQETSPYLRQHADNPVDWHAWGEEALRLAAEQNKPILLSIGYSACHWCHVMAHESFEDPEIEAAMNRYFVNIKVDREERPDLDQIYQAAHHMLTQRSGGWPLTMFLTPDQRPFFGGTYFPKRMRYGLPGFAEVLERVNTAFHEEAAAIAAQNNRLQELLSRTVPAAPAADGTLSGEPMAAALAELKQMFDPAHGGFGSAPKFPHPAELELCLALGIGQNDERARHVALHTLRKMAEGGIYDQLGGGFCRYSVDHQWTIPHFEKMLYDNGPLLRLYADACVVSDEPLFERVCQETAAWVMREMQSPEGGYYSSLDADSEHEEGKFYVWSRDEVAGALSEAEYAVAGAHYGLDLAANFEGKHWHLWVTKPLAEVAGSLGLSLEEAQQRLASARAKLWRDGHLLATYKDGRAHLNAYLDDHAFLLAALLELMQARFRAEDLQFARDLAEALLVRFEDETAGGFFFTSRDHEPLILRPKPGPDSATPSGNGSAARALQRFGHLVGEARYLDAAERALRLFHPQMQQHAGAFSSLCLALADRLQPPAIVIVRGSEPALTQWREQLARRHVLSAIVLSVPSGVGGLPEAMDKPARPGVNAWICRGVNCLPPISDAAELERAVEAA